MTDCGSEGAVRAPSGTATTYCLLVKNYCLLVKNSLIV